MDLKLELVILPVSDVDRAKRFYEERLGFHVDVDTQPTESFRIVQLTPPGSACSVAFGIGLENTNPPGSVQGLYLVVDDIVGAREELVARGAPVGEIRHMTTEGWQPGPHPQHERYNSFADIRDPDGNTWVLQEVPPGSQ